MATNIFSLFGTIFIDNKKANKSLDETTKKGKSTGDKLGKAFKAVAKGATAVVTGAAAVGTAAFKMAQSTATQANEVDKFSQKMGLSKKAYQEWDFVLSQADVEITSMTTGLKTLTNKLDDAKNGSSSASEMFGKLGLSMEQLNGMSREEVFESVIKGMQGMEDSAERAALANDLFGKSGQELTPLFNETIEDTERLKNKAHELGMVMEDDVITAGADFMDSLDVIKRSAGGMLNRLGSAVMPIIQSIFRLVESKMPQIHKLFSALSPIITKLFNGVLPPLFNLIETLLPILLSLISTLIPIIENIIKAILPVIVNILQMLLPFIVQIIEQILPLAIELIQALMPIISDILNTILPVIIQLLQALIPPIIQIIQAILPVLIRLIQLLLPPILQIIQLCLPILISLVNTIMPMFTELINAIMPILLTLINTLLPPILQIVNLILPLLAELIKLLLPPFIQLTMAVLPVLTSILDMIAPLIKPILDLMIATNAPLLELLQLLLPPLIQLLKIFTDKIMPAVQRVFKNVADEMTGSFKNAFTNIGTTINHIVRAMRGVIDFIKNVFTGNWRGAWQAVVSIFSNIFNGLKNHIKLPLNIIIDSINTFIKGLNKLKIPDWIPSVGGKGVHLSQISRLRVGMEYVPYDEFPALLHKGERVLTAGENKEYKQKHTEQPQSNNNITVKIEFTEKSVYVESLNGKDPAELNAFIDEILEIISEKIKRKGVVFA